MPRGERQRERHSGPTHQARPTSSPAFGPPPKLISSYQTPVAATSSALSGVPYSTYSLQRAPSVTGPWTTSAAQTAPASGLVEFWDLFPAPGQAFYRTVQP